MPYKHAHWGIALVLVVILAGFWASYFTAFGTGTAAFHVHAMTAIAWLTLLLVQHVSIHRRVNAFHRQMGLASLAIFPLLMLGFVMIINVSAQRLVAAETASAINNTPAFGIGMVVAMAAYLTLFYNALKHRRNVKLHAGFMLATPLILFESPFSRIIGQYLPWLNVIGSEGPQATLDTIVVANTLAGLFALWLYLANRRHGLPWLLAAGFTTLQSVLMWFAPSIAPVRTAFTAYAQLPPALTLAVGVALGVLAGVAGWRAGSGPAPRGKAAAMPAG